MRDHAAIAPGSIGRRFPRQASALLKAIGAVACVAAALAASAAAALTAAGYILPIEVSAAPVDALVVLGGFGVPRAELAAGLFAAGAAPLVVVTGAGDCDAMRETLIANGVPADAVASECISRSTLENARNTTAMLRGRGVRSAKLITHWFHARRAIATFRASAPEVLFSATSVLPAATPAWRLGWTSEPKAALAEYAKIAWYALRYGVFVRIAPEPNAAGAGG